MKRVIALLMLLGVLVLGGYQIVFGLEPPPPCAYVCDIPCSEESRQALQGIICQCPWLGETSNCWICKNCP
jgi:hypothetical protein